MSVDLIGLKGRCLEPLPEKFSELEAGILVGLEIPRFRLYFSGFSESLILVNGGEAMLEDNMENRLFYRELPFMMIQEESLQWDKSTDLILSLKLIMTLQVSCSGFDFTNLNQRGEADTTRLQSTRCSCLSDLIYNILTEVKQSNCSIIRPQFILEIRVGLFGIYVSIPGGNKF